MTRSVDADPFEKPYKIVFCKLSGPPVTARMEPNFLRTAIDALFPSCLPVDCGTVRPSEPVVAFSEPEIEATVKRFRNFLFKKNSWNSLWAR